ncbi:MAG TPA: hypothetical protein DD400_05630 [Rhodospirillaceae bacterium]|nr:hypothetical protein [Rhodospirillaceae bacterium]
MTKKDYALDLFLSTHRQLVERLEMQGRENSQLAYLQEVFDDMIYGDSSGGPSNLQFREDRCYPSISHNNVDEKISAKVCESYKDGAKILFCLDVARDEQGNWNVTALNPQDGTKSTLASLEKGKNQFSDEALKGINNYMCACRQAVVAQEKREQPTIPSKEKGNRESWAPACIL